MGCTSSIPEIYAFGKRKKKLNIQEVVVFVPAMRVPVEVDLHRYFKGLYPGYLIERLSALRRQIVFIANDTAGSAVPQLKQVLEEYLPLLLGLTRKEREGFAEFRWTSLDDAGEDTCLGSSWFELLSVLHMMAILSLSEANLLLIPKGQMDALARNVSEDCKKDAIDLLLNASGYLEFCIRDILPHLHPDVKQRLSRDLQGNVLEAISVEALGQATEMQLGLAVESQKATLSVKRRLACEQMSYFAQAHNLLSGCDVTHGYGKKHLLFIKWKYIEGKAAAYYYHGLILDKGNEPSSHIGAVCCFLAAEELLTDSKKACLSFCLAAPVTRSPPVWGVMKHLHLKVPEVASRKYQMYGYLLDQEKALQTLPDLPDFPVSLRPDDYSLPEVDPAWDVERWELQAHTLKEHLKDCEFEMEPE
ncbi:uncharacterized protein LOC122075805 isoform X1 [Macadamia integrifolia]|uniref:uncharacterized protein LOC122075805 isoform X1 n=1 Tax=Macadamia integrifolia TaxID=60698 RepID=UPI001C4E51EA|nr:uncharacterized protein LOC122075805 isoform X1 [Macadamia integrifolia]XP_042496909.1 uncharacterized protein LOC122075805 isoform X1 [Macadamia integrifolia]